MGADSVYDASAASVSSVAAVGGEAVGRGAEPAARELPSLTKIPTVTRGQMSRMTVAFWGGAQASVISEKNEDP